jgi:hypothetical protein
MKQTVNPAWKHARLAPLSAACILLIPVPSLAEVSCPDTLHVQQRADVPDGWTVNYAEQSPRLSGVIIFDGPPSNRASIKYNYRTQTAKEIRSRWDLVYSPRSQYLQCSYERTTAQIAMPLPAGVRMCEVVYDRNVTYPGGGLAIKRMTCK